MTDRSSCQLQQSTDTQKIFSEDEERNRERTPNSSQVHNETTCSQILEATLRRKVRNQKGESKIDREFDCERKGKEGYDLMA